jgi:hypothetical protein
MIEFVGRDFSRITPDKRVAREVHARRAWPDHGAGHHVTAAGVVVL